MSGSVKQNNLTSVQTEKVILLNSPVSSCFSIIHPYGRGIKLYVFCDEFCSPPKYPLSQALPRWLILEKTRELLNPIGVGCFFYGPQPNGTSVNKRILELYLPREGNNGPWGIGPEMEIIFFHLAENMLGVLWSAHDEQGIFL